jgi:hypothetical protein
VLIFDVSSPYKLKNILGNIIYVGLEESQQGIINKEKAK